MGHTEAYPQAFLLNQLPWGYGPQAWGSGNANQGGQGQGLGQGQGPGQNFGSGGFGPGQAAFGQGGFGQGGYQGGYGSPYGQSGIGWGQQRQLSHNDIGEVVRQLLPLLPQVLAQAQQQPQAAYGFGPYNQGPYNQQWGQSSRTLSQQDVNEVVRQILPAVPQIVSLLQGQGGQHMGAAIYGSGQGWSGQPWQGQYGQQQPLGPFASAAYGGGQGSGQSQYNRQLNQADIGEVVRQLTAVIPQVIANLQNQQQQRPI
jgi:hypothetical protein